MPKTTVSRTSDRPAPPRAAERRATVRYAMDADTSCSPLASRVEGPAWAARVRDISRNGLGLVLNRRFEPGTVITVDLPFGEGCSRLLLARVVHSVAGPGGGWIVGCKLVSPLTGDELALLGETAAPRASPGIPRR
jgi:hypothetical protein